MRVIHVCAYYAPAFTYGGPVHSVHALCKAQQAHGIDVEVFTTNANGSERLPAAPRGRNFDGVPVRYFELSAPARLLGAAHLPRALAQEASRTDIVHLHGLFNRTIWDAAACLQAVGKPYVLSPRGMLEAPALAHHRWRKRLTWTLKDRTIVARAAVLHATSAFERQTLERQYGGAIVEIPNTVALTHAAPREAAQWRASMGIPADSPIVLALGRMHRIKRLDLVASSFVALRHRVPHAHLVIAGPDEHRLRPELEARLGGVLDAVRWTGPVSGIAKQTVLGAATVLVQCSDSESFGMSIAEALGAGLPVVATRTCPWPELETWGCGLWVEQSLEHITAALAAVILNPEAAKAKGQAGRRLVHERMSAERIATAWHAVYRETACANPAAA